MSLQRAWLKRLSIGERCVAPFASDLPLSPNSVSPCALPAYADSHFYTLSTHSVNLTSLTWPGLMMNSLSLSLRPSLSLELRPFSDFVVETQTFDLSSECRTYTFLLSKLRYLMGFGHAMTLPTHSLSMSSVAWTTNASGFDRSNGRVGSSFQS
jgi:hypothetical protein